MSGRELKEYKTPLCGRKEEGPRQVVRATGPFLNFSSESWSHQGDRCAPPACRPLLAFVYNAWQVKGHPVLPPRNSQLYSLGTLFKSCVMAPGWGTDWAEGRVR